jgi:hypothetical protein
MMRERQPYQPVDLITFAVVCFHEVPRELGRVACCTSRQHQIDEHAQQVRLKR